VHVRPDVQPSAHVRCAGLDDVVIDRAVPDGLQQR
jgi:hypothetical protein